ncbi:MAG: class I SAM-dependent methyltransferase [Myxococcota bacterium]
MTRFDQEYYRRYYLDHETQVASAEETARLARFVGSYVQYLNIKPESALDLGCGLGLWRAPLRKLFPDLEYRGVEVSEFLAHEFGWELGSVVDYDQAADLVVCQGVLQYLPARAAERALRNLSRLAEQVLYLEVLTQEDWDEHCDQSVTDGDVYLRSADWYRRRIGRHFLPIGGGVFLPKDSPVVLYELERWR